MFNEIFKTLAANSNIKVIFCDKKQKFDDIQFFYCLLSIIIAS